MVMFCCISYARYMIAYRSFHTFRRLSNPTWSSVGLPGKTDPSLVRYCCTHSCRDLVRYRVECFMPRTRRSLPTGWWFRYFRRILITGLHENSMMCLGLLLYKQSCRSSCCLVGCSPSTSLHHLGGRACFLGWMCYARDHAQHLGMAGPTGSRWSTVDRWIR